MSNEESKIVMAKTWSRVTLPVSKIGFADGASDGQNSSFQPSFDTGYAQGLTFGLQCGFNEALSRQNNDQNLPELPDPRRINCQLCLNMDEQAKIDNLYNNQEERNKAYCIGLHSLPAK